jgi:hypothetical protein
LLSFRPSLFIPAPGVLNSTTTRSTRTHVFIARATCTCTRVYKFLPLPSIALRSFLHSSVLSLLRAFLPLSFLQSPFLRLSFLPSLYTPFGPVFLFPAPGVLNSTITRSTRTRAFDSQMGPKHNDTKISTAPRGASRLTKHQGKGLRPMAGARDGHGGYDMHACRHGNRQCRCIGS